MWEHSLRNLINKTPKRRCVPNTLRTPDKHLCHRDYDISFSFLRSWTDETLRFWVKLLLLTRPVPPCYALDMWIHPFLAIKGPLLIVRLFLHNSSRKSLKEVFVKPLGVQHLDVDSRIGTQRRHLSVSIKKFESKDRSSLYCRPQLGMRRPRNPLHNDATAGETPAPPAKSDSKTRGRGTDVMTLTPIVTGTRPALHVYFFCWKKRETLC